MTQAHALAASDGRPARGIALLVALVALLPYLNSWQGEFVFDDHSLIAEHKMVTGAESALGLLTWVHAPDWYRPVTMLTYAANARLGESPFGYHLVNSILHAMVSLAVLRVAAVLLGSSIGAAAAALLFAVHPIHTEAVSSIVGRAELLAALFVLCGLLAFVRGTKRGGGTTLVRSYALSAACFGAGLLSKESALTAVALIPLVAWRTRPRPTWPQLALIGAFYSAVACAYLCLRVAVIGAISMPTLPPFIDNPLATAPLLPRLMTAGTILFQYVLLLVAPANLSSDYSFDAIPIVRSAGDSRFIMAAAMLAALLVGFAATARRAPAVFAGGLFAAITMALTANVLFPIGTIKAERLLYLPSVGYCVAVGWLVERGVQARPRFWTTVFALVLAGYAARTWVRNRDWRNDLVLSETAVAVASGSAKAHYNLATAYFEADRFDEAMTHYRRSLEIFPPSNRCAYGIGRIYELRGQPGPAFAWYERAMALGWDFAKPHARTGVLHYRRGEWASAESAFRTALDIDPDNASLQLRLAATLLAEGDLWRAGAIVDRVGADPSLGPRAAKLLDGVRQKLREASVQ